MPLNPPAPETRVQTASRFVSRHSEAACLIIGILLGAVVTLLGVTLG